MQRRAAFPLYFLLIALASGTDESHHEELSQALDRVQADNAKQAEMIHTLQQSLKEASEALKEKNEGMARLSKRLTVLQGEHSPATELEGEDDDDSGPSCVCELTQTEMVEKLEQSRTRHVACVDEKHQTREQLASMEKLISGHDVHIQHIMGSYRKCKEQLTEQKNNQELMCLQHQQKLGLELTPPEAQEAQEAPEIPKQAKQAQLKGALESSQNVVKLQQLQLDEASKKISLFQEQLVQTQSLLGDTQASLHSIQTALQHAHTEQQLCQMHMRAPTAPPPAISSKDEL